MACGRRVRCVGSGCWCVAMRRSLLHSDRVSQFGGNFLELDQRRAAALFLAKAPPWRARAVPRYEMNVIVRNALARADAIVLEHVQADCAESMCHAPCDPLGLEEKRCLEIERQVEDRLDMDVGDEQDGSALVLGSIHERRDERPACDERAGRRVDQIVAERAALVHRRLEHHRNPEQTTSNCWHVMGISLDGAYPMRLNTRP